ncbi:putative dehydrogenase [Caulobacter ginsengisoli]|uniref:Dehydrogenase n=1 Tax=Caulobacter ginsengisoli TaxID=400775 RepID=A0ABU0IT78_9CAUL|nr:Gfo/Idh/MocA family oxidoreductase [Caulobacter ginsengisoli]MDQ0464368.1 putative dehydrogenase [Caulobacter ginsengisoli]
MSPPLRIGILGAARIAPPALIAPARDNPDAEVVAVAARDGDRARAFAETHGIPEALDNYEALIASDTVDAIYNALPPARHADLTVAALKAGKHVLCEKPFALNAAEAQAMVTAADETGQVLMEAFHYRYHPMFEAILAARAGLGRLKRIEAVFSVPIAETPGEIRYDAALGGGALMDLGTYPLHWCRSLAGREPRIVSVTRRLHAGGADIATRAELDFGEGLTAVIDCAMDEGPRATLEVEGELGRLSAINPLSPQLGHQLTVGDETMTFSRETTYSFQLKAFVAAVQGGPVITGGRDAVGQMAAIDAIRAP